MQIAFKNVLEHSTQTSTPATRPSTAPKKKQSSVKSCSSVASEYKFEESEIHSTILTNEALVVEPQEMIELILDHSALDPAETVEATEEPSAESLPLIESVLSQSTLEILEIHKSCPQTISSLEAIIDSSKEEQYKLSENIRSQTKYIEELEEELKQVNVSRQYLEERFQQELKSLELKHQPLLSEIEALCGKFTAATGTITQLKSQKLELEKQISQLENVISDKKKLETDLRLLLAQRESAEFTLIRQLGETRAALTKSNAQLHDAFATISQLRHLIGDLEDRIKELDSQVALLVGYNLEERKGLEEKSPGELDQLIKGSIQRNNLIIQKYEALNKELREQRINNGKFFI